MQNRNKRVVISTILTAALSACLMTGCAGKSEQASSVPNATPTPAATQMAVTVKPEFAPGMKLSVCIVTEEQLKQYTNAQKFVINEEGQNLLLIPSETLSQLTISSAEYDKNTDAYVEQDVLYGIKEISPDSPLLLKFTMPDTPGLMINYCDESGDSKSFVLAENGEDGSPLLIEQGGNTANQGQPGITQYTHYGVTTSKYEINGVVVHYPQITDYYDAGMQDSVNKLILSDIIDTLGNVEPEDGITLDMGYELTFTGSDIMSIKYTGLATQAGNAQPVNILHTANINMKSGTLMMLGEVVKLNNALVAKFKQGTYIPYSDSVALDRDSALSAITSEMSDSVLLSEFSQSSAAFYFSDDALVLSVQVSHAAGDHIEFAIPYGELGNRLLLTPQ